MTDETIIVPTYLIRGIKFFQNIVVINRGIPFMNTTVPYSEIKEYENQKPIQLNFGPTAEA